MSNGVCVFTTLARFIEWNEIADDDDDDDVCDLHLLVGG